MTPLEMLDRAAAVVGPTGVGDLRAEGHVAIRSYLQGVPPLASAGDDTESAHVMPERILVYVRAGWEPVAGHRFMDTPAHLRISRAEYAKLSLEERADVAVRVALREHVGSYARMWLEAYGPEEAKELWRDGELLKLQMSSTDGARAIFIAKAEEIRARSKT